MKVKVAVFLDDIILYLKNPRKQTKKTLVNNDRMHKVNGSSITKYQMNIFPKYKHPLKTIVFLGNQRLS